MKTKKNIGGYERIHVGGNIRKWRSIKGVKQKDLASLLRVSEATLSNIENDLTDLTLSQLEDIAIGLEIEVEALFSDPGEKLSSKITDTETAVQADTVMEKEIIYALIGSIKKKDEQLEEVIQNMIGKRNFVQPGYM